MEIRNGKIVKATNIELFYYWLKRWSDLLPYDEYKRRVIEAGTEVTD